VRELFRGADPDHSGDSLDGVKTPKQIVEENYIDSSLASLSLYSQQIPSDGREMLIAFGVVVIEKLLSEVRAIVRWIRHASEPQEVWKRARATLQLETASSSNRLLRLTAPQRGCLRLLL